MRNLGSKCSGRHWLLILILSNVHTHPCIHTHTHTHSLTVNFAKAEEKIVGLEQQIDQLHEENNITVDNLQRELEKTSQRNQMSESHTSAHSFHGEDSETDVRTVHSLSIQCDHLRSR